MNTTNKVAINTIVMYIQLIFNVLVGLFSVRLILNALGASDFGLYNLIAGIITMLSFINSSLSQTSIRYLSVAIGENSVEKIRNTFSSCISLHLFVSVSLALLLEILGLFIFDGFLNIPDNKIGTSKIIFHCMVVSLVINISSSPLRALLVSHESFIKISIWGIVESSLKLLIAIVIGYWFQDKLLAYGLFIMLLSFLQIAYYYILASLSYKQELLFKIRKGSSLKEISGFAGWTLLDVLGTVANRQGYAIMLNVYFGTIMNAVFAIARQIEGHIFTLSSSVVDAMKPQIMISKGAQNEDRMFRLSLTAGKFGFIMMSLVAIPLIVNMPMVLQLWLKNVPEGTALFSSLMIIACMIEQLTRGLVYANQAHGDIKYFSIVVSVCRFLALPISCIAFSFGAKPIVSIFVFLFCESVGSFSRPFILSRISSFKADVFYRLVFCRILPVSIVCTCFCYYLSFVLTGILGLFGSALLTDVMILLSMYFFCLTKDEKLSIRNLVKSRF